MYMSRERFEEMLAASRLAEIVRKKEEEQKAKSSVVCVLATIGALVAIAAVAYGVYCFFVPDYFEDEFEDEFEEDFFDSADEI